MRQTFFLPMILLAACERASVGNAASNQAADAFTPTATRPGGVTDNGALIMQAPTDPRSAEGAARVLKRYFALMENGSRGAAARLWSDSAAAAAFASHVPAHRETHATVGAPGRVEGSAGSAYVEVALELDGRTISGERFSRKGTATLRRTDDVPGSSAEQRQWRVMRIALQPDLAPVAYRFIGRWATDEHSCANLAWHFTVDSLRTPAGSVCRFQRVTEAPGGYDIAARCTAEGPPTDDRLKLRFAESARALLLESHVIADTGLVRCP